MTISSSLSHGNRALRLVFDPSLSLPHNGTSFSCFDLASSKALASRSSFSSVRTRCSRDSVYPRGKARLLSLSEVLHSNPTWIHCVNYHKISPAELIQILWGKVYVYLG